MNDAGIAVSWLLGQEEPEARRVAVQQLVKVRSGDVAELFVRALGDSDWRVRKEAASIATSLERRDEVVRALVRALDDKENIGLRNAAVEALITIGTDVLPAVIDALDALDADGRKLAVEILGGVPDERAVRALARALDDADPNVRCTAAEALRSAALAGEASRQTAVRALMRLVASDEVFLKLAAFDALTKLDAQLPWSVYEPLAADPLLRRYAVAAAAHSDDVRAIDTLVRATAEANPTVVREAALAIGERVLARPDDVAFTRAVREQLRVATGCRTRLRALLEHTDDVRGRGAALIVLGLVGDATDIPLFVEALADDDLGERAERALQLFGSDAVAPLLTLARDEQPERRASVLSLVPTLAPKEDGIFIATLREALDDGSPEVVVAALRVLGASGQSDDIARAAAFATHDNARIATAAAGALAALASRFESDARAFAQTIEGMSPSAAALCILVGSLHRGGSGGAAAEEDVRAIESALSHGDPRTRRYAVEALAVMGGEAAADAVSFALADEEHDVQLAAVRALGQLGRVEPLSALIGSSPDPGIVAAALRSLSDADPVRTVLTARPLVRHENAAVACAAVEAIGRLSHPRYRDALFEALEHSEAEVVKRALSELATSLDARALAHLGMCLDHASWEVRRLVAELLGQDGSPPARALLRARLDREKDPVVREAIADGLAGRSGSSEGT